jgi:hypothetical protein
MSGQEEEEGMEIRGVNDIRLLIYSVRTVFDKMGIGKKKNSLTYLI